MVSRGVGQGSRVALWTAIGAVSAGVFQLPLLAIGVASLVARSPFAFDLRRYAGGLFLVWLAIRLLSRKSMRQEFPVAARDISKGRA